MTNVTVAAIMRSPAYSPNHIGNDAAVLNAVATGLRRRGHKVMIYTERELQEGIVKEPVVVSMSRERTSLALLQEMEYAGRTVINSAYGIENCRREFLGSRLRNAGLSYADGIVSRTDCNLIPELRAKGVERCWVKRADTHSQHKEDVTFAFSVEEAQELVHEYFMRGIPLAEVQRHIPGVLIKFYGVAGTNFFHCYHRERGEGGNFFGREQLADICGGAASALGLDIYGGDAVFNPESAKLTIINVNDWPSFAPCRPEAVKAIIGLIQRRIKKK